ncbi:MAG TPA: bis(5'-nucleosyl)-tetraphosphatase (symmetrical) YqeK [Candidatus Hydrogenedentes bacterium]|nr:bis(5'-nucleosyl)-tetraphosphatase (symmetrical) YqeK [Candidatus Hydrogenedentota bacterium]
MPLLDVPRAEEYVSLIRARLSEKTANHCISATELMLTIADRVGIAAAQCVQAGLLHDLCKGMSDEDLLAAARRCDIPVSDVSLRKPKLLHGPVSAEECRRVLGIDDEDVLDAIRWHTTGHPEMGTTGLALYFADFSEPLRTHPEAAEARAILTNEGFMPALLYVSGRKLHHVLTKAVVDPNTLAFHNWLQRKR